MEKIILITGGSSGIGLCCVQELAKASPEAIIITASRTAPSNALPSNVHHHELNLASRQSVRNFVNKWSYGSLSALVCNAGMAPAGKPTHDSDGIELTFAVNHVNQALLFFLLKEKNLLGPRCRFVWLTSATHDPKQPMNQGPAYWPDTETVAEATDSKLEASFVRYSTAKLGTIFFSYVLASKIKEARQSSMQQWTSILYEPGFTPGGGSRLQRDQPAAARFAIKYIIPYLTFLFKYMGIVTSTPAISGKYLADIALNRTFVDKSASGKYILLDKEWKTSEESYDIKKQQDLWRWTVDTLADDAAQKQRFESF